MSLISAPVPPTDSSRTRRWRLAGLVVGWLLLLVCMDVRLLSSAKPVLELDVEMDSTKYSVAQAFFDTGKGFNNAESATAAIAPGASQSLVFPLPAAPVHAIRFDPLTASGTVHLHRAAVRRSDDHDEVYVFDLNQVTASNEIAQLIPQPGGIEVVTTPDSTDSQLRFATERPIDTKLGLANQTTYWIGVDVGVTLFALLAVGIVLGLRAAFGERLAAGWRRAATPLRRLDTRFAAWAARLSRPEVASLDRWVFWFYAACLLTFGGMAAAGLHGSSLDEYSSVYPLSGVKTAPLLGQPRGIRSDEWTQETPAFFNQAFRRAPFDAKTSANGRQYASLLLNLPTRDFTVIFRPQYWPFFVLPFETAFAIYWQAKGFLLLTGTFSLLLLLTQGRTGLAALGALWLFFSAHTQWCYSWPSMLPEMIGCFGWTICLTLYLSVGRNRYALAAAAAGGLLAAVQFALCFYPPHQIPFVLFGAGLVPVWMWQHRALILRGDLVGRHLLALAACWGGVALAVAGFGYEIREGIATATHTVYPGQRVVGGGGVPLPWLISQWMDFWKTEARVPAPQGNICESSGYLWLLPFTLLGLGRRRGGVSHPRGPLVACWGVAALVVVWIVLPVPAAVGHWLLLDRVPPGRCLPALGLINVVGVILYLSLRQRDEPLGSTVVQGNERWAAITAIFLGVLALLALTNSFYQDFFHGSEILLGAGYTTLLVTCLLMAWSGWLTAGLLVPLVLANGLVNPIDRGVRVVTQSALFRAMQGEPHLRENRWLVYSRGVVPTGFVVATGADVFNSFKVLPNLRDMAVFDPQGRFVRSYNQSGFIVAQPLPEGQPSTFENVSSGVLLWSISPLDPALRQIGVRFLAFDEEPEPALVAKLRRIHPEVPGFFLYETP